MSQLEAELELAGRPRPFLDWVRAARRELGELEVQL